MCDDWSQAVWGDRDSEYYFYLYDETDDGQNLKFWQWPRVDPTATFFKNNSFCEDGLPSTVGKPAGEYYILFAHQCETDTTTVTSGTYGGCGKQPYVPCKPGFDCTDCGRTPLGDVVQDRRRLAPQRGPRTLPALGDRVGLEQLLGDVHHGLRNGTIVEAKLPDPHAFWLQRFDPERMGVERFESRQAMQTAFANFVAERRR